MLIKIDTDKLPMLAKEGSELVFKPEAEDAILKLLQLQALVEQAIDHVKQRIEAEGIAYNPNFKSVQSDKIKVGYRAYGGKYSIDPKYLEEIPPAFYSSSVRYFANTKNIDEFLKTNEALPLGVNNVPRAKQISLKPVEEFDSNGNQA